MGNTYHLSYPLHRIHSPPLCLDIPAEFARLAIFDNLVRMDSFFDPGDLFRVDASSAAAEDRFLDRAYQVYG